MTACNAEHGWPFHSISNNLLLIRWMLALLIILCLLSTRAAQAITVCQDKPGAGEYWRWRQIDGRQCWFAGRRNLEKSELSWPAMDYESTKQEEQAKVHESATQKERARTNESTIQSERIIELRTRVIPEGMSGRSNAIYNNAIDLMRGENLQSIDGLGSMLIIPPYNYHDSE
jgi:hypothetical protein